MHLHSKHTQRTNNQEHARPDSASRGIEATAVGARTVRRAHNGLCHHVTILSDIVSTEYQPLLKPDTILSRSTYPHNRKKTALGCDDWRNAEFSQPGQ